MHPHFRVVPAGILLIATLCPSLLHSQSPSPDDSANEGAVVERDATVVHYNSDGTGWKEQTAVVRIQSEAGVRAYGQVVIGYASATESLEVNYVRVRKPGGQVIETPPSNTQDFAPEALQAVPMYDDFRQKHITVAGLRPGDMLEYKFTTRYVTAIAPGQFWFEFNFPRNITANEVTLTIEVPAGRQVKLKSPDHPYTTGDTAGNRTYSWKVANLKPETPPATEEEWEKRIDNAPTWPDVQLTSFPDWASVSHWYAQLQSDRAMPDETVAAKARELTRGATSDREKVRRLYDYVAKEFRYVSLSFGVGRMQPHFAREVLAGNYGDCKDKHTLLQALLAAVGIHSYPVLINGDRKLDEDIPSPSQFDHVITLVSLGQEWVWLDTTAEVSPFGFLTYDLRNKQALLVASGSDAGLRRTAADPPVPNTVAYSISGRVSETGTLDAAVDITASGDSDLPLRANFRSISGADRERMAQGLSSLRTERISDLQVSDVNDTTKPIHISFHLRLENFIRVPSPDQSFAPFTPLRFERLRLTEKGSDKLLVGPPVEETDRIHLQLAPNISIRFPQPVAISSSYGEFTTTYRMTKDLFEAQRRLVVKANEAPAARRYEIESLRSVASNFAAQTLFCSSRPASRAAEVAADAGSASLDDLTTAASKALNRGDYPTAAKLFEQVTSKDASSKTAWDLLGRAYLGANRVSEAASVFQKQTETDPEHKTAYADLGIALQRQRKNDEAIAAYQKQLARNALDRTTHRRLGFLYASLARDGDAIAELEQVTSVPPDDPEAEFRLAMVYQRAGKTDKAKPILMALAGVPELAPADDVFAAALNGKIDPQQTLTDATKTLSDLSDQEDFGPLADDPGPTMTLVALQWARVGAADLASGNVLESLRYFKAAWMLSQSGVVGNRLAALLARAAGQSAVARRTYAMAFAAGGPEQRQSRAELAKLLNAAALDRALEDGKQALAAMSVVKLSPKTRGTDNAELTLSFDGSPTPDRISYTTADIDGAVDKALIAAEFPVMFPDASAIKIIRRGVLSCASSGCSVALRPLAPLLAPAAQSAN